MVVNKEQLKEFFIQFTYSNLQYENDYEEVELKQVESIFNNTEIALSSKENIVTAINNHKALYNNFYDICNKHKEKLSLELVKETHCILMKNLYRKELKDANDKPGQFKKGDYIIGLFNVGAKAEEVEEKMQELIDEVNAVEITEDNVFKIVGYLHNWICNIHPFADGNGMVARFLVNYLLMVSGFNPVILGVARKEISRCINILERFDDTQDIWEMAEFIESNSIIIKG